jgi:hypothetical protein
MKSELQLLKEANDILRSVNSIIERKGNNTNWEGIDKKVNMALAEQHELLLAKNCYISDVINQACGDCLYYLTCNNESRDKQICDNYDNEL